MNKVIWGMIFIPLGIGLIAMLLIQNLVKPLPIIEVQVDVGTTLFLFGILITLPLLTWQLTRFRLEVNHQKTLQEDRARQESSHRRFLRRLDHQIKNPLTALRAVLANLSDQETPSTKLSIQAAELQTDRLGRLLSDLRKLAEFEELPLETIEDVNVPNLLSDVINAVRTLPANGSRQIDLVFSRVPWLPPAIHGDPDLLSIVFYNLLENALKYSTPKDAVEIRVLEDGRFLTVEVADTGQGISEEDLPHLFEELFRGENSHGQEGSGLGLALAQRIVQHHNGTIDVRSRKHDQKGTVFNVRLPLKK